MNNYPKTKKGGWLPLVAGTLILLGSPGRMSAAFEETSVGGRSSAMGGLFTALTDDVNAIYHNPAGLAGVPRAEFSAQYSRLYIGMDDKSNLGYSFMGAARPFNIRGVLDTLGAGWLRFSLSGLYQEDTFMLSYATRRFHPLVDAGITMKYLRLTYGQDEYTANAVDNDGNATGNADSLFRNFGTTKGNLDFDLGLKYRFADNYMAGFMIENLLEPNVALDPAVSAPVPRTFKAGIAHTGKTFAATIDGLYRNVRKNTDWEIASGVEKTFSPGIALRGGVVLGSRELMNASVGLGYRFEGMDVDYALIYPVSGIKDTMGSHRFSLLFRFGPVIRTHEEMTALKEKLEKESQQLRDTETQLAAAQKEIDGLRAELKTMLERPVEKAPPKLKPAAEKPAVKETPSVSLNAGYLKELNRYRRSSTELSLNQRVAQLKPILEKYKGSIDVSEAEHELETVRTELSSQEKYFNDSMVYYRKMAVRGITREERIDILKRIIRKYRDIGIDITPAQKELDDLTQGAQK